MKRAHIRKARRIGKSMLVGAVSGLAASWVMNQYWAAEGKLKEKFQPAANDFEGQQDQSENPTVKVADAISQSVTGQGVPEQQKPAAGTAVHYGFGAAMGAVYGLLSEVAPVARVGFGLAYASALWLAADEIMLPALKLSKRPDEVPPAKHLEALGAHLVYGATTEGLRRALQRAA